jgi:hypothetical protein
MLNFLSLKLLVQIQYLLILLIAAMLVDRIMLHKNREACHNGVDAEEQDENKRLLQMKEAQDKRISAGLLAAAGHYNLGSDVHEHLQLR